VGCANITGSNALLSGERNRVEPAVPGNGPLGQSRAAFCVYLPPLLRPPHAQVAHVATKASDRERQLAQLMTRASEAADGAIVNAIAYQDEYNAARANLRSLRKAAEVKKCQLPEPVPAEPRH
jgi:hypothetical protein